MRQVAHLEKDLGKTDHEAARSDGVAARSR
jgi:hypothetical protein